MLALDHRGSIKKLINSENPDSVSDNDVIKLKEEIINSVKDQMSGLLVNEVSEILKQVQDDNIPYLLPVERSGFVGDKGGRINELEYSVAQVKKMGAKGVKLLVYFNPDDENSHLQLATANHVLKSCKDENVPMFLEVVTYGDDGKSLGGEGVLRSLNRFIDAGVVPDVWKLEYPGSEDYCQKVTELVDGTPWILLTRGDTFDVFVEELKIAVGNGCIGFLAGRALWQEVCTLKGEEKNKFLNVVLPERFKKISEVALRSNGVKG